MIDRLRHRGPDEAGLWIDAAAGVALGNTRLAVVDLSDFRMTIHAHGHFVGEFAIGIGRDGTTPIGKFTVKEKLADPTYYGPEGVVSHDDRC